MFIMPSFKKSLIVEQFQGNYLKHYKFPKEIRSYLPNNNVQQSGSPFVELRDPVIVELTTGN